jgi:hypothetical protein
MVAYPDATGFWRSERRALTDVSVLRRRRLQVPHMHARRPNFRTSISNQAVQVGMPHAMVRHPDTNRWPANQGATNMRKTGLEIRKLAFSLAALSAILLPALYTPSAQAQNFRSWVSRGGSDTNDCTSAFPCATFTRALSQTFDVGQVSCFDSGSFEHFTVTFSVTIDCTGTVAITNRDFNLTCANDSVVINAPGKVVTLRGLKVTGGCQINGINIQAATAVYIEDCVIENNPGKGIVDTRTTGLTKLAIKNTIVRNNGSAGIVAAAAPKNSVVLESVHSAGNTYGIAVATGNNVVINRSVMSENTIAGVEADPGAQIFVDNTEISHNVSYGIYALGTVWLANSDIAFNTTSISGATTSYGNNRLAGNGGGTAPTPSGAGSTDFGQQ